MLPPIILRSDDAHGPKIFVQIYIYIYILGSCAASSPVYTLFCCCCFWLGQQSSNMRRHLLLAISFTVFCQQTRRLQRPPPLSPPLSLSGLQCSSLSCSRETRPANVERELHIKCNLQNVFFNVCAIAKFN